MNILVIAPHPDDETIGCGGALARHAAKADRITVAFLTSGELGLKALPREEAWRIREAEAKTAARCLGLKRLEFFRLPDWGLDQHLKTGAGLLRPLLIRERPKLIYLPHPLDWHPDHRAALPLLRQALRALQMSPPELRAYEVWTPLSEYDHVEDISRMMPTKLRALRAHRSQLKEFDYVRAICGLNQFRGAMAAQCQYAEVFAALDSKHTASVSR
jgi:N-acetylglucosamine malate deacetylase 1